MSFISSLLSNLNYGTILFLMLLESTVVPVPSEFVVTPAAYHAASGQLDVWLVILFATIGADLGASINYVVAYYVGRPVIYRFANSRIGHMCLISEEKVANAEAYFDQHGAISTFVGRLIPAIRQLISIPAGLARMNLGKFLLFTTLGSGLWNMVLAFIGYYLSKVPGIETQEQLLQKATEYSHEIGYVILGVVILIVGFLIYKGWKK